jgi:drug/metabolite transporter (DMT)-like permease
VHACLAGGVRPATVNRKALLLFAATSVIWGSSFLFIRVAVEHLPPSAVVFGRTVLGAAFLVPLAIRSRAFRGVRQVAVPIVIVTVLDMAAPTFLTAWGEQHISSSAAGILTATDPLFTAALALWLLRSEVPGRKQLAGLIIGFAGVVALLGIDFRGSAVQLAAGAVLLRALGYAGAALVYRRWLADVPAIGVTALMTAISSVAFLTPAAVNLPRQVPPASSILALATLGIINTGVAYWLFYLLIDQAGAGTAAVITYVMPVVALPGRRAAQRATHHRRRSRPAPHRPGRLAGDQRPTSQHKPHHRRNARNAQPGPRQPTAAPALRGIGGARQHRR